MVVGVLGGRHLVVGKISRLGIGILHGGGLVLHRLIDVLPHCLSLLLYGLHFFSRFCLCFGGFGAGRFAGFGLLGGRFGFGGLNFGRNVGCGYFHRVLGGLLQLLGFIRQYGRLQLILRFGQFFFHRFINGGFFLGFGRFQLALQFGYFFVGFANA